ncbi:replication initiation negative regulator SeqA [Dongshaea marina]|uniref:replication initiation negative regulator SeqA n=1 Tax=Dongshaea marina TaxID=2047966 RepID=UPI000D3EB4CD|nr:replication initiation negative regulator SeqA [Dongshaea marina]
MKTIEVDDELYFYIASQTRHIGESASDILRRLLQAQAPVAATTHAGSLAPQGAESGEQAMAHLPSTGELLASIDTQSEETSIARFMRILSCLYQDQQQAFIRAADIRGRKRVYFSRSQEELLATGKTTKPRPIPQTPYWVITNTNTSRKRNILIQLMENMGYNKSLIQAVCDRI